MDDPAASAGRRRPVRDGPEVDDPAELRHSALRGRRAGSSPRSAWPSTRPSAPPTATRRPRRSTAGSALTIPTISLATVYKALEALVGLRPGHQALGRATARPLRRPPRPPLPLPLPPLGHGRGPADADYDPDLIAKLDPGLADRLGRRGFRVTGYRLELVGYFEAEGDDRGVMTPPALVDTHAHLDDPGSAATSTAVLGRARAAGVVQVVAIATTALDSASVLDLAGPRRGVFAAVGIHPNDAAEAGRRRLGQDRRPVRPPPRRRPGRDRARPLLGPHAVPGPAGLLRSPPRARPRAGPAGRHPLPRGRGRHPRRSFGR